MEKTILSQTIKSLMICISAGSTLAACGGGSQDYGNSSPKLLATTSTSGPPGFTFCANENGTCSFSGVHEVAFGANGTYYYKVINGSTGCNNTVFGDPAPGVVKACFYQTSLSSSAVYRLVGVGSNLALDVAGAGTADGTNVDIWTNNGEGSNAQKWQANLNGDGTWTLINPHSGKALDDAGGGTAYGTNVQIATSNGGNAQRWRINANSDGSWTLINVNANLAMDVYNANTTAGTNVDLWPSNGGSNQKWFMVPFNTSPTPTPTPTPAPTPTPTPTPTGFSSIVSQTQFNTMFPSRNSFYTYDGLVNAANSIAGFATTGTSTVQKQEAAAFLANVAHETGGLVYIEEIDKSGNYCNTSVSYGCPAGTYQYYGRGPLQLSWNTNYKAAGDWMGVNLLNTPSLVATDATISWKSAIWYWMTQNGPNTMTAHYAMINSLGFGQTIRSINGGLECNGQNTAQMQDRVNDYNSFVNTLGVPAGSNLTC